MNKYWIKYKYTNRYTNEVITDSMFITCEDLEEFWREFSEDCGIYSNYLLLQVVKL